MNDSVENASWAGTWRPLAWITFWSLGLTWIFLTMPTLDLYLSECFYDSAGEKFPLARHPAADFLNDLIEFIAVGFSLFTLVGLLITTVAKRRFLSISRRHFIFLFCTLALGPGLLVNGFFKALWGRARPRYLEEFGGSLDFSPAWILSDQCTSNCSFVSGDAAMAFSLFALTLCIPNTKRFWGGLSILFGVVISISRLGQGAHFASDVIFAGLITLTTIFGLKALLLDDRKFPLSRSQIQGRLIALGFAKGQ